MRERLYRAKRKDIGEWVEGYYAKVYDYLTNEPVHVIFPLDTTLYPHSEFSEYIEIIPETVCRLLERDPCWNGGDRLPQRFFQYDIVRVWHDRRAVDNDRPDTVALVIDEHTISENGSGRWFPQDTIRVKVIGNVFDNPELLGVWDVNRFTADLGVYSDDYLERHRKITDKYNIHGAHAGCYIGNFESEYLCRQWRGGCPKYDVCRSIREQDERKE